MSPSPSGSSSPGETPQSPAASPTPVLAPVFPDTTGLTRALVLDLTHAGPPVNPTQFGHMLEDINHACEGGIYANILRNSNMKEGGADPPSSWQLFASGGGNGAIARDTSVPLDANNPYSLQLTIGANNSGQRVGVVNSGFYGIGLQPSSQYDVSFYARSDGSFSGPFRVVLQDTADNILASANVTGLTTGWKLFNLQLQTASTVPQANNINFAITAEGAGSGSSLWFNIVQCFAPSVPNTHLRADLVERLKNTNPGFIRIPGGNYLEGLTLDTRFDWQKTLGPQYSRPGHQNDAWNYWSTDGMGLLEYLELAETLGAEPILGVYAGYNLNGNAVAQNDLRPYVQDALDEIDYVVGEVNTPGGARRAADGHPDPFPLHYVEIGNEDFFDATSSYNDYRFPMFYDAIRSAYPGLLIVATRSDVTSRFVDVFDNHTYENDPNRFVAIRDDYDDTMRPGPRFIVGEFASVDVADTNPTGTLGGALGEAAFMTGLLRNADVVLGAAFAPALAQKNNFQWPTNLLAFDSYSHFVSPSYYVQQIFGTMKGDYIVPIRSIGIDPNVSFVASRSMDGNLFLIVVNSSSEALNAQVVVSGATEIGSGAQLTVLSGDPASRNSSLSPNTVTPPGVTTIAASPSFSHAFAPFSVSALQLSSQAPVEPSLTVNAAYSLSSKSPTYVRQFIARNGQMGTVNSQSSAEDKASATYMLRSGLGDASCYSFESKFSPGNYLLQQNYRIVQAIPQQSMQGLQDATFCASVSTEGAGVQWTSNRFPTRYLRQYHGQVWIAEANGPLAQDAAENWPLDTVWIPQHPAWWQSDVAVQSNTLISLANIATDGSTSYLRHSSFVAFTSQLTSQSTLGDRQDATFWVRSGLADPSCVSFESAYYPGFYLRHLSFRLRLEQDTGGTFLRDATFCAEVGRTMPGITWRSLAYAAHTVRNFNGQVWTSTSGGFAPQDTAVGYDSDVTWVIASPLAP